jgi:hypothetical protein
LHRDPKPSTLDGVIKVSRPKTKATVLKAMKAMRDRRKAKHECRNGDGRPVFKADRCEPCYEEHKATANRARNARTARPAIAETAPEPATTSQAEAVEPTSSDEKTAEETITP